jgi:hypothetical protein
MTTIAAYIEENRSYLSDSLVVLEQLTNAQFQVLKAVTEEMGNADVGIDNSPVKSHETLADFDFSRENHWAECGSREASEIEGHQVVFYNKFQPLKGQQRRNIAVVQFDGFTVTLA